MSALEGPVATLDGTGSLDGIDEVHRFRTSVRRLRSFMITFGPFLTDGSNAALSDELAWIGGVSGEVRDADILLARVEAEVSHMPDQLETGGRLIAQGLAERRRAREQALVDAVASERFSALLGSLRALVSDPPVAPGVHLKPAKVMAKPWRSVDRGVAALPEQPSDVELHKVRISIKRVRYAAEAFEPVCGKSARRFVERAAAVQSVLGEQHDAAIAATRVLEEPFTVPAQAAAAGWLAARCAAASEAGRHAWRAPWSKLARPSVRFW